ncbi:MAG: MlaD family protein [bacterium]
MQNDSLALKVGLFVLTVFALFITGIVFLGFEKQLFTPTYSYTLSARSGIGFNRGMPVLFSGFEIGSVENIRLSDNGRVLIDIKISSEHRKWIRDNSVFIMEKPLIGQPRIIVETKEMNAPLLSSDSINNISIVDDINEVIRKADPVLKKITDIADNLTEITDVDSDLRKGISHMEKLSGELSSGKTSLMDMTTGSKKTSREIRKTISNLRTISEETLEMSRELNTFSKELVSRTSGEDGALSILTDILKDISGKLTELDTFVNNINNISGDVKHSSEDLENVRKKIDIIMLNTENLIKDIQEFVPSDNKKDFELP